MPGGRPVEGDHADGSPHTSPTAALPRRRLPSLIGGRRPVHEDDKLAWAFGLTVHQEPFAVGRIERMPPRRSAHRSTQRYAPRARTNEALGLRVHTVQVQI